MHSHKNNTMVEAQAQEPRRGWVDWPQLRRVGGLQESPRQSHFKVADSSCRHGITAMAQTERFSSEGLKLKHLKNRLYNTYYQMVPGAHHPMNG
jgi:hypothetical protein